MLTFLEKVKAPFISIHNSWKNLTKHQQVSTLATFFVLLLMPVAYIVARSPMQFRNQAAATIPVQETPTPTPIAGFTVEAQPKTTEIDFDFQQKYPQHSMLIDAILRYDGNFVYDQSGFEYIWSIADGSIIKATLNNDCRPGTISPCPYERALVQGLKLGNTTMKAVIKRKTTGEELGSATFGITVTTTASPSATLTPSPTPTLAPTRTPTPSPTLTASPSATLTPTAIPSPTLPGGKIPNPTPGGKSSPKPKPIINPQPIKTCSQGGESVFNSSRNGSCCSGYAPNFFSVCSKIKGDNGHSCSSNGDCKSDYCTSREGARFCAAKPVTPINVPDFSFLLPKPNLPKPKCGYVGAWINRCGFLICLPVYVRVWTCK